MNQKSRFIISVNIRKKRRELELTQKQLADKIGVRYQYIQKWEGGTKPSVEFIGKIAEALNVNLEWLLENHNNESNFHIPANVCHAKDAIIPLKKELEEIKKLLETVVNNSDGTKKVATSFLKTKKEKREND